MNIGVFIIKQYTMKFTITEEERNHIRVMLSEQSLKDKIKSLINKTQPQPEIKRKRNLYVLKVQLLVLVSLPKCQLPKQRQI